MKRDAAQTQTPARPRSGMFGHWRALSWPARILAVPIYIYRLGISPLLPRNCRFEPTCSTYALEALQTHGVWRGTWLTLRRLSRCHPFERLGAGQGFDPVPPARGGGCGGHGHDTEKGRS